ncbi:MAG TPA: bifunctional 4-hydroxy-2-oxoglutarate aldolase/2-dehydro-3-deoxy-phosphogluconate aldolase [Candidatus Hydrogenedens sp.]|nr:bifunctional 4-hydroxy-2-oxoglutarate aldolase/2-dehydro-3-deoxy-phosphogluconate aldolase [Candidatus Hydrogenedens sp.]HOK10144.1 bifunctional 4-hydroxy-2-oxoglutarate aldolase/2-dehydro-3-deoxy-phosphogluconate aldolase [Candidatus Hydrogenedens sp.]HOL19429.1 bifunctional 4-hydroxy-2-oxoglutarate aldolase/2-dehydro-3-deoxy-phosphogluconate aldolase [Candidatus Hydrogenedens sp.]HPP58258.1 bifunctional 4-hydroxy-2-oxoglutarate aldolase/2-dehydro-3-deoxy-phosphogluconate aldolase [Candidatu
MNREDILNFIRNEKIIAVIRADLERELFHKAVRALYDGGIHCVEITMTSPDALSIIEELKKEWKGKELIVGTGTVLDAVTCRLAILAGTDFIVTPTLLPEVIDIARNYSIVSMCGGFTPTELLNAWKTGADFVKLFPASVGGPEYIKAILGPLPNLPIVPTGGINHENAKKFLEAGAIALGIGGNLVSKKLLASQNYPLITETAQLYKSSIQ